jgi:hypothetical protein
MHIAITVGTLLLGSWVLNAPEGDEEAGVPEEIEAPTTAPAKPSMPYTPSPGAGRTERRGAAAGGTRGGSAAGSQAGYRSRQAGGMPMAPTETDPQGVFGRPSAPTSGLPALGPGAFVTRTPSAPTARRTTTSDGRSLPLERNVLDQSRGSRALANSGAASSNLTEKAFAGFRPSSGVSPYMNLFRPSGDGVDNYTSLVRPQIDQRFMNQQFNRDIHGLENSSRMQGVDLRQLYRSNQTLQGVGTPQFYMNYGNYYQEPGQ